jgi:hypothetical protein
MNLPPLNELYNQDPFASSVRTYTSHGLPLQGNSNQQYLDIPRSEENDFPPLTSISSTLPSLDAHSPLQSQPACIHCKGQKYSFTAYFHNAKIFPEPPHEVLHWVERSYILKNRLQSLLVTYALHTVEIDHIRDIEVEINNWAMRVDALAHEVGSCGSGSERILSALTEVHRWMKGMIEQLWKHVRGAQTLPMPKGRLKEVVLEFRKAWERVWIACAEHLRIV